MIGEELNDKGAFILGTCRKTSDDLSALSNTQVIENCEITDEKSIAGAFESRTGGYRHQQRDIFVNHWKRIQ